MEPRAAPLYRTLRTTLEAEIAAGRYPAGARFPTDHELKARFGVSRHTVREALRAMQDAGLLVRLRGSGTVVARRAAAAGAADALDDGGGLGIAHVGWVRLGPALAAELGRPEGERWLRFAGLGASAGANGRARWIEAYVAAPYAAIREAGPDGEPIHRAVARRFALAAARVELKASAAALSPGHAARLGAEPGGIALVTRRSDFAGGSEEPFVVTLCIEPGEGASRTISFRPLAPA